MKKSTVWQFYSISAILFLCAHFSVSLEKEKLLYSGDFIQAQDKSSKQRTEQRKASQKSLARTDLFLDQHRASSEDKKKDVLQLIKKGVAAIEGKELDVALDMIIRSPEYKLGDLYLSVMDDDFTELAGFDVRAIWEHTYNWRDDFGAYAYRLSFEGALKGGKWFSYSWRHVPKSSFSQMVRKDGKIYVVGCGHYPVVKADYAVGLVKAAVDQFYRENDAGHRLEKIFALFGYPTGKYVQGDLFLYVLNNQGIYLAYGGNIEKVGVNGFAEQDDRGVFFNRELVDGLKNKPVGEGFWGEYLFGGEKKRLYAEKAVDKKGKQYYIAVPFFADTSIDGVVQRVRKGGDLIRNVQQKSSSNGVSSSAIIQLQSLQHPNLYLRMYTMDGLCVVDQKNNRNVGANRIEQKDEDGRFFIKELIALVQAEGSGWLSFAVQNAFANVYAERVDAGGQSYLLFCEFYPNSEREVMILLVKSAVESLRARQENIAFHDFGKEGSRFIRAGLSIFVFDLDCFCYVWGLRDHFLLNNLAGELDEDGRPYIKMLINSARGGPTVLFSREFNRRKFYYAEPVVKNGKTYIVGSGCYS